jgi:hypothetical protein
MSRSLCALFALGLTLFPCQRSIAGVTTSTFENLNLPPNSYDQNAGPGGFFPIDGNSYNNVYDPSQNYWSGWALSSTTDTTTPGYLNQFSAITGSGAGGSATYAVAFTFGYPTADAFHPSDSIINLAAGVTPLSLEVTNTTYAYLAMKEGDPYGFSHPFGPGDFFQLTITGYSGLGGTGQAIGEVGFYLANFLGSNRSIVDTWQTLDLSGLGGAESLVFGVRSTDNDPNYGMNTPAYFAMDNFRFEMAAAVPEPSSAIMILGGLGFLGVLRRIKRSAATLLAIAAVLTAGVGSVSAGIYAPQVGQPGSLGIAKSSPLFQEWASSVVSFNPGPQDISNPSSPPVNFGSPSNALGAGSGDNTYGVVSLGDGGSITLGFDRPIANGTGADFAVFENGFLSGGTGLAFLEIAFVDVSSDGVNFFRFPAVSLTPTTTQVGGFGLLDASNLHNLAGKYTAGYGTGFDLEELAGISPLLDINRVIEVRITDVGGSINPAYGSVDSLGNMVNDPFSTPFNTGGFDLNGVGVIHVASVPEPSSVALILVGLGGLVAMMRRQF